MPQQLLLMSWCHHIPQLVEELGHGGWAYQVTQAVLWREYLFPGKGSCGQVQMPRRSPGTASWVQTGGSAVWEPARLGLDHCQLPALPQDGRLNHSAPSLRPEPHVVFIYNKLVKNEKGGKTWKTALWHIRVTERISQLYMLKHPSVGLSYNKDGTTPLQGTSVGKLSEMATVSHSLTNWIQWIKASDSAF